MDIRNIAIIAHVDHGKTTIVDGLLKQSKTFRENQAQMEQELIMDSNDQERERGITILAKNTAIQYNGVKINIIDTPGHADFGGEVERTLNMCDGALLIVDAKEGPMPQTKFVLKKALEQGLRPIVVINKIDKGDSQIDKVISDTSNLFLDLATDESQLDFPIYYAIGKEGKAWSSLPSNVSEEADLTVLFEAIINEIPAPASNDELDFQMLVSNLDWDNFQGKYAIGKITRGVAKPGLAVVVGSDGVWRDTTKINKVYLSQGLGRFEADMAVSGDIVAITGIKDAKIGDTISGVNTKEFLASLEIAEPTLKMAVSANTSPLVGKEGVHLTSQKIYERILKELEINVSLKMELGENNEYILSGRGELHLSVFIETLRREGFELQIAKPQVITKVVDGQKMEPIEELFVDVQSEYANTITGEIIKRRGVPMGQVDNDDGSSRLSFKIPTRGLLGLRNVLLTLSRGTAAISSMFIGFEPIGAAIPKMRNGALIASEAGKAVSYGINNAQQRGIVFISPQTPVYEGMIVGLNSRDSDLEINVTKEKKQSNVRSSGADTAIVLTPPTKLSLEQSIDFLEDDELLEVTPKSLRLRKKILNSSLRARSKK